MPDVESVAARRSVAVVASMAVIASAGAAGRSRNRTAGAGGGNLAAAAQHRGHLEGGNHTHGRVVEVALGQRGRRVGARGGQRVFLHLQGTYDDGFAVVVSWSFRVIEGFLFCVWIGRKSNTHTK